MIQSWDFRLGRNFVLDMQKAANEAKHTITVLSESYLQSVLTLPEWAAAFAQDLVEKNRTLIPVRVKVYQLTGLLAPIVYIDLVSVAAPKTIELLRTLVTEGREGKEDSTSKQ